LWSDAVSFTNNQRILSSTNHIAFSCDSIERMNKKQLFKIVPEKLYILDLDADVDKSAG
jgi:hypothetical protein